MCVCVSVCLCVCVSVCLCVCVSVCLSVWMYVCMHACMHGCMDACMHACMHACMYVCMYIHMYVCVNRFRCVYIYALSAPFCSSLAFSKVWVSYGPKKRSQNPKVSHSSTVSFAKVNGALEKRRSQKPGGIGTGAQICGSENACGHMHCPLLSAHH